MKTKVKQATQSIANSDSYQDDDELFVAVNPGQNLYFELELFGECGVGYYRLSLEGPSGSVGSWRIEGGSDPLEAQWFRVRHHLRFVDSPDGPRRHR